MSSGNESKSLKKVLIVLFVAVSLVLPAYSFARSINYESPCEDGGMKYADGTYNPLTGAVNFIVTIDNCSHDEATINGLVHTSGTIIVSAGKSNYDIDLVTSYDNVSVTRGGYNYTISCLRDANGEYDPDDEVLTGGANTTCSSGGTISIDLDSLISEVFSIF